ncbi:hypothetical protein PCAR4_680051 [Paraburkholderia caribensis]|nr:hypothetical protein PCAR4_680051 [Paraburkholderia caribensis]
MSPTSTTARPGWCPRAVRAAARVATSARKILERAVPSISLAVMVGREWAFRNAGGAGRRGACDHVAAHAARRAAAHALAARAVTDAANRTDGARRQERVACRKAHGAKTAPQRSSTLYR